MFSTISTNQTLYTIYLIYVTLKLENRQSSLSSIPIINHPSDLFTCLYKSLHDLKLVLTIVENMFI